MYTCFRIINSNNNSSTTLTKVWKAQCFQVLFPSVLLLSLHFSQSHVSYGKKLECEQLQCNFRASVCNILFFIRAIISAAWDHIVRTPFPFLRGERIDIFRKSKKCEENFWVLIGTILKMGVGLKRMDDRIYLQMLHSKRVLMKVMLCNLLRLLYGFTVI